MKNVLMRSALHLDRKASPRRDSARSLKEALQKLISDEYGEIVIHSAPGAGDDYGLGEYLRRTWPAFLDTLAIRFEPYHEKGAETNIGARDRHGDGAGAPGRAASQEGNLSG